MTCLVILSDSEVSINLKRVLNDYGFFANAQNDNALVILTCLVILSAAKYLKNGEWIINAGLWIF